MKKRIEWAVVQSNGKDLLINFTRARAREDVKWYKEHMFDEWVGEEVEFPLRIERREWLLKDVKVVA